MIRGMQAFAFFTATILSLVGGCIPAEADTGCAADLDVISAISAVETRAIDRLDFRVPSLPRVPVERNGQLTSMPLSERAILWRTGWNGLPPPPALVRRWLSRPPRSIGRCFPRSSAIVTIADTSLATTTSLDADAGRKRVTFSVTAPAFSPLRSQALIFYALKSEGSSGRTEFAFLQKDKAMWKVVGRQTLSVF